MRSTTNRDQENIPQPYHSLEQLFSINLEFLSPREKALLAKSSEYLESHNPQKAAELVALGAPKEEIVELVSRVVKSDLEKLEPMGTPVRLFRDSLDVSFEREATLGHSRFKTLDEFSQAYKLTPERTALSTMSLNSKWSMGTEPINVLKAAMMTKDLDLMNRAFEQALKFGEFNALTAIASELKNNDYLIVLGRLSLARYLFFDRNHNWLYNGLRSFSEVTGGDKRFVEQILYDLYDIMLSPAILGNESIVRTYGGEGSVSAYTGNAAKVLKVTLPMVERMRGDSSSGFQYLYARTDKSQYVYRLKSLMENLMQNNESIGELSEAIIQIQDPSTLLHIGRKAEAYSKKMKSKFDESRGKYIVGGAMKVARDAFVMSGDLNEIKSFMVRALAGKGSNPKNSLGFKLGFVLGEESLLAPKNVVEFFRTLLVNPSKIFKSTTNDDLIDIKSWIESYEYNMSENKEKVSSVSKIFYDISFRHEEESIKFFLSRGEGASLEKIQEFIAKGEKMLGQHDYWPAMSEFISAKNIDGLERTYVGMLTKGRPLDAVYAALAIEWIQTGRPVLLGHEKATE